MRRVSHLIRKVFKEPSRSLKAEMVKHPEGNAIYQRLDLDPQIHLPWDPYTIVESIYRTQEASDADR